MPPVIAAVAAVVAVIGVTATIIVGTALVIGATLLVSTLLKPRNGTTTSAQNALTQTLDPEAYGVIVLGRAPGGNDERFWEVYDNTHDAYTQIIAVAGHRITSYQEFYIEGVEINFSLANSRGQALGTLAQGTYGTPNYLAATTNYSTVLDKSQLLEGAPGVNFPTNSGSGSYVVGSGSLWTINSTFTGCAHYVLNWYYNKTKLPSIPARCLQIVEGSPVYDPRKDSTVGGSGSHRAGDNTTWTYSDLDSNGVPIGRNNALQMLRYLIGWHITSPQTGQYIPVDGRCVNLDDIDYANFMTQANICESEGYYTDCTLSTQDTHSTNEGVICAGAGAVLLDTGGLWSYHVATNDTASIAVAFTDDDIISNISWNPKDTIANLYNEMGGTFVDPTLPALYQSMPYPPVTDATYLAQDNNIPKRQELDFQNVFDPNLAQKLARIALNKNRLTGIFKATFNWKALQANNYDCVTLSFANFGWTDKLFRIISIGINPIGGIDLALQEEDSSVYTGGTINTYAPGQRGVSYDLFQEFTLAAPTLTSVAVTGASGTVDEGIEVTWSAVSNGIDYVEVYYYVTGATTPNFAGRFGIDVSSTVISPVAPNTNYTVEIRTISINNVPSAFASSTITTANGTVGLAIVNQGALAVLNQTNTPQIVPGAVSNVTTVYTSGNVTANSGSNTTIQSATITISSSNGIIINTAAQFTPGSATSTNIYLYRGSTLLYSGITTSLQNNYVIIIADNPGAGTYTYTLQVSPNSSGFVNFSNRIISTTELKV